MDWVLPLYSKGQVDKAGKELTLSSRLINPETQAIISNWRASHALPLHTTQSVLRYNARRVNQTAIIVQRLKRLTSIESKLQRFSSMKLSRMQDIGGCRAILSTINEVYQLKDILCQADNTQILKDYIREPKISGYRGIHLKRKYLPKKDKYNKLNGLQTEIQIRTQKQHSWATAVEIAGTFTGQNLKAGEKTSSSQLWLDFFESAGYLFAVSDGLDNCKQSDVDLHKTRIEKLEKELRINEQLFNFTVTFNMLTELEVKKGYLILNLDVESRNLKGMTFSQTELNEATQEYIDMEQNNPQSDIVLLPMESLQDIKTGYPNYFADSELFRKTLEYILKN